jgi:threonyl-tRNA synthetase
VSVDYTNESVGKKIRSSEGWKIPYTVVIGEKEITEGKLTPRVRSDLAVEGRAESSYDTDQFLKTVANEIRGRVSRSSL